LLVSATCYAAGVLVTETYFHQDDILKGKIQKQIISELSEDDSEIELSRAETIWDVKYLHDKLVTYPYTKQTDNYTYNGGLEKHTCSETIVYPETETKELPNNLIEKTAVINYGDVDNPLVNDEKTQVAYFDNSRKDSNYIIMLPSSAELKDNAGVVVSKSWNTYNNNGQLIKTTSGLMSLVNKDDTGNPSTSYEYNSYGNLIKTTDPLGHYITTIYDDTLYQYPKTIENQLGQTQNFTYSDPDLHLAITGVIIKSTDPNGQITENRYDSFDRLERIYGPLDTDNNASVIYEYDIISSPNKIIKYVKQEYGDTPKYIASYAFTDGFGRALQTKSPTQNGQQVVSGIVEYDYKGSVIKAYLPYYSDSVEYETPQYTTPNTAYEYDVLGRIAKTINADSTFSTTAYSGWQVTYTDEEGNSKDSISDAYGQLKEIIEHNEGAEYHTYYTYDTLGNLTQVQDNQANITTIYYDSLGRKTSMQDPDMGTWSYEYDKVGNLIKQTDNKSQEITFEYDELNRLTAKTTSGGVVQYIYDDPEKDNCIGRLSKVVDPNSATEFFYDELGREIKTTKSVGAASGREDYTVERTYDAMDRLVTLTYPNGETVTYTYNDNSGQLESISNYVDSITYNVNGQMTQIEYANDTKTEYEYNLQTLRLSSLRTTKGSEATSIQDLSYQFDNVSNITSITDAINTATQTFTYDNLSRLKTATGAYGQRHYAYDSIGNITQKGNILFEYAGSIGGSRPHAVTSSSNAAYLFTYDDNGNMINKTTADRSCAYEYDTQNRLIKAKIENPGEELTANIQLQTGWNFISLPVMPDNLFVAQALSSLEFGTDYDQVTRLIPGTGGHESWCNDPRFNQFETVEFLRGYQIYALRDCTLTIIGTLPQEPQSLQLHNGRNLIGIDAANDGKMPNDVFADIPHTTFKTYIDGRLQDASNLPLIAGKSYYITVTAPSTYYSGTIFAETTFTYDGDGGRIKRTTPDDETIFIGSLYEITNGISKNHIFMGDTRIATAISLEAETQFYHGDHLGSSADITDDEGKIVLHTEYMPYGETYIQEGDEDATFYLYTGKLFDSSTGLYYYGARYYDPEIGRFTQADTIVPDPANPQAYNRYGYANNNPIRYNDPTGHSFWDKVKKFFTSQIIVFTIAFILGGPQAACSITTLIAATAAAATTLTLDTGEGRQLIDRVGKEFFDDVLGMKPKLARQFSSIGLHIGGSMLANAGLNAMINSNIGNTSLEKTKEAVDEAARSGQTQQAGDIGQKAAMIEGKARAVERVAKNALKPPSATEIVEKINDAMNTVGESFTPTHSTGVPLMDAITSTHTVLKGIRVMANELRSALTTSLEKAVSFADRFSDMLTIGVEKVFEDPTSAMSEFFKKGDLLPIKK